VKISINFSPSYRKLTEMPGSTQKAGWGRARTSSNCPTSNQKSQKHKHLYRQIWIFHIKKNLSKSHFLSRRSAFCNLQKCRSCAKMQVIKSKWRL
jgi:hypothetical protein